MDWSVRSLDQRVECFLEIVECRVSSEAAAEIRQAFEDRLLIEPLVRIPFAISGRVAIGQHENGRTFEMRARDAIHH
jgi:hypothetical protein